MRILIILYYSDAPICYTKHSSKVNISTWLNSSFFLFNVECDSYIYNYFSFYSFRVYCEYNSLHDLGKEKENSGESFSAEQQTIFDTPEEQLLHFLDRTSQPRWKWMSLRPRSAPQHGHGHGAIPVGHHAQHFNNLRQSASKKTEPYYCDRALVQSLVRDAIATDELDGPLTPARGEDKQ